MGFRVEKQNTEKENSLILVWETCCLKLGMSPKQNDLVKYISLYSPQAMNSYGSENSVDCKTSNWKIIQILVGSRAMQAEKLETYFFRSALFSTKLNSNFLPPIHVLKKNCFVLCNGVKSQFTKTNSVMSGQSLYSCLCFKLRAALDLFFSSSTSL